MLINGYNESLISHLEYNRRFQECCYLLGLMHNLKPNMSLNNFWPIKEKAYLSWADGTPQIKSILEYSIIRICRVCNIVESVDNFVFIFTCAHYGVARTSQWIKKGKFEVVESKLDLVGATLVVRYLHSLILKTDAALKIDPLVELYIDQLYELLKNKGWENSSKEELQSLEKKGPSPDLHSIPLVAANVCDSLHLNNKKKRYSRKEK